MDIKEIIKIYGLAEDATEEDVRTALKAGRRRLRHSSYLHTFTFHHHQSNLLRVLLLP